MTEKELSLKDTLFSGQCFRVSEKDGLFSVTCGVGEKVRKLELGQRDICMIEDDPFWANFFDLQTDYESMKRHFCEISPIMKKACDYSPGIRILRQDPWEALCSFVVSQNNNIKRIMGIVDRMCREFGVQVDDNLFGFPEAAELAGVSEDRLRGVGIGFRAPYIHAVSVAVCEGKVDFGFLTSGDIDEARKTLMSIRGIGPKVADCALLFGCHRLDCFPLDVWMKKVMKTWFDNADKSIFGEYAGVAQQYLFHFARTGGCNDF